MTAVVGGKQVTSNASIPFNGLRQIAYTFEQGSDAMTVRFYDGNRLIGEQKVDGVYRGNSELRLGFDYDDSDDTKQGELNWYKGDMMEFRLWNRALSSGELAEYGQKALTGYEHALLL